MSLLKAITTATQSSMTRRAFPPLRALITALPAIKRNTLSSLISLEAEKRTQTCFPAWRSVEITVFLVGT